MDRVCRHVLVTCALLLSGAACHADAPDSLVVTRDSAGVMIVESSGPSWTPESAWTVDPTAVVDLGQTGTGPMYEFFRIADATFSPDGGIAVAERGAGEVRFYDANGHFAAVVGRPGDGPGEFQRLNEVMRYGKDSLLAFDFWARRATIISASGSLGRSVTFHIPDNTIAELHDHLFALQSGEFILSVTLMPTGGLPRGRVRMPQLILKASVSGTLQDTLSDMRGGEVYIGSTGITEPPYPKVSWAAIHRDDLYVCEGDEPQYVVRPGGGPVRRLVRLPSLSLKLSDTVLDSIRDALRGKDRSSLSREMAEALPPTAPFCSSILLDPLGYVWVERFHHSLKLSAEPRPWLVFSPDGEWLGQLALPANFEVFEVGESRVLGMAKDSMEVETVQVLALKRR